MIYVRDVIVWFLSFLLAMPPNWVLAADITVDAAAPAANQATVTTTPSAKPMLYIVAPNASGVSHNKFTDFNVSSQGLVINNATALTATNLAGVIEANPNLSGTAASLILNEVTSANRSTLSGATEIGGQAADYILANPNGITCNGCGFINTPRATLTTGTPTFTGTTLTGLSVNAGDVVVEGLGLDASNATKFDIVTRAATINAQINASDLGIHTGRQDFDYVARSGTAKADDGSTKPSFAIDSTALGGMYARRITLVGTEAGVGVRVAADMAASTGDMILTSDGKLELKSDLSAATDIQLTSSSNSITADKVVYAGGNLTATANSGDITVNASASLGAAGDVTLKATNVTAGSSAKIVAGMSNTGALTTNGALDVQATTQITAGDAFLGGGSGVLLKAPTVDLSRAADDNSETVRSRGTLRIESGNLTAANGRIASDGAMTLAGNSPIILGAGVYSSPNTITLTGDSVTSAATLSSDQAVNITSTIGDITNTGSMTAGTTLNLNSAAAISNSGTIESQTGTTVTAASTLNNQSGAKIKSAATTTVTTGGTLTNAGSIFAVNAATLTAPTIANSGSLAGGTDLTINVGSLTSSAGVLYAQNNMTIGGYGGATNATLFDNDSGYVETVTGDITIKADTITNQKSGFSSNSSLAASGTAPESSCAQYNTVNQCIRSYYTVNSPIGTYNINDWSGYSGLSWFYYAGSVSSSSSAGLITAGRDISLSGATINNYYSTISAVRDIDIQATDFNNQAYFAYGEVRYNRPQYTHLLLARQAIGSEPAIVRAGGNLTITATGGVRNSTEQSNATLPANVTNINAGDLAVSPTPSALLDTAQYADLIPGRDALFLANASPTAKFLFETRVEFINVGNYFGSDYFINQIGGVNPADVAQRLGDAYFDTTLVREAITRQTGERWLDDTVKDDIQQMKTLLDNGAAASGALNLAFGISLTQAQINALTSDIVWYVEEEYQGQTVLVPKVYLANAERARIDPKGAILEGHDVTVNAASIDNDRGRITGANDVALTATTGDLTSTVGEIAAGNNLTLTAGGDITATGSTLTAGGDATLNATGDVTIASQETRQRNVSDVGYTDEVRNIASSLKAGGKLTATAGGDLTVKGSTTTAGGDLTVTATGDVNILASTDSFDAEGKGRMGKMDRISTVTQNAAALTSGGKLSVTSGGAARITGSELAAATDLDLTATGDVTVDSSADRYDHEVTAYKKKTITQNRSQLTAGGDVSVGSLVGNLALISSELQAGGDIALNTPNGTLYLGARKDYFEEHISETKSGMGGMMLTYINRGQIDETVVPTLMTANGTLAIVTGDGVIVDYKDTGSLTDSIDQLSQAPGLAWMKQVQARGDVDWNAIEEVHKSWDYRSQGISPMGAALISLAVSAASGGVTAGADGWGASFFGIKEGATQMAVANAGFSTLVSQAATAVVGNGGDLGAALKQLGSVDTIKALATSMVTAGLIEGLGVSDALGTPAAELKKMPLEARRMAEFASSLKIGIAQAAISSTVDSVINGAPLTDNLKNGLVNAAITAVSQTAFKKIGDLGLKDGSLQKVALHALTGCAVGQASSKNCMAGAMAAGLQEALGDNFKKITKDPALQTKLAGVVGALAVTLNGGDLSAASTAASIGEMANHFNRQLHTFERQAIQAKAEELAAAEGEGGRTAAEWEQILGNEAMRQTDARWADNLDAINDQVLAEKVSTVLTDLRTQYGDAFIASAGESFKFLERDKHYDNSLTFSFALVEDRAFYDNVLHDWAQQSYGGELPTSITASELALVEAARSAAGGCGRGFESCSSPLQEMGILAPTQSPAVTAVQLTKINEQLATTWLKLSAEQSAARSYLDVLKTSGGTPEKIAAAETRFQQADRALAQTYKSYSSAEDTLHNVASTYTMQAVYNEGQAAFQNVIDTIENIDTVTLEKLYYAQQGVDRLLGAAAGEQVSQKELGQIFTAIKDGFVNIPSATRAKLDEAERLFKAGDLQGAADIYGDMSATTIGIVVSVVGPAKAGALNDLAKTQLKKTLVQKKHVAETFVRKGGVSSEQTALDNALTWLGENYKKVDEDIFLSADGTRRFTFDLNGKANDGAPEIRFESYDTPGGKIIETSKAEIIRDEVWSVANNLDADLPQVNLSREEFLEIAKPSSKLTRPDPSTYMSQADIDAHLSLFDEGAVRFTSRSTIDAEGTIGSPTGTFVMPKKEFDDLLVETGGNLELVEKRLGLTGGQLTSGDTVAAFIKPSNMQNLRISSGREKGANAQWIPGGKTSGGVSEAVIDAPADLPYSILQLGGN